MAQYQKTASITMILAITMAALYGVAVAQSSGCDNELEGMSPCLNYISGDATTPSSGCCSQLAIVVQTQPQCLCQVLNGGGSSFGIKINETKALDLPKACNVQTPSTSKCNGNASSSTGSSGSSDVSSTRVATIPTVFLLLVAEYAMVF
ncbi:hypothetical protein Lser_V15G02756 [Lactuca serriola]